MVLQSIPGTEKAFNKCYCATLPGFLSKDHEKGYILTTTRGRKLTYRLLCDFSFPFRHKQVSRARE